MGIKTIAFGGDTSLGYRYFQSPKWENVLDRVKNNPTSFFCGIKPSLQNIDHLVLNLETVLSETEGEPALGKLYCGIDDPENTLKCLDFVGAKTVSLANNHAMDFGVEKLLETIVYLKSAGIEVVGAGTSRKNSLKPAVVKVNEGSERSRNVYILGALRASRRYSEYGFFAKNNKPGLAKSTAFRVDEEIKSIKLKDPKAFVVLYPHWQGKDYGEVGDIIKRYCRERIDAGADLIIGHGTHSLGSAEKYNGCWIFHSIGNFVFNSQGQFSKTGAPPLSAIIKLDFSENGMNYPRLKLLPVLVDNKLTEFNTHAVSTDTLKEMFFDTLGLSVDDLAECSFEPDWFVLLNKN
ncbi:CapA family protein [Halomonas sp. AOP12-C2-37]|uniref:CapA family protein n=1 Tax=Halomonas casei TaxID=2742613 RepID=A0ABR9EZ50_9GAMM|nr:CapA family protein [Halomonas casei]MBE0398961.1 CapA family protein [Halomonas casei]